MIKKLYYTVGDVAQVGDTLVDIDVAGDNEEAESVVDGM